MNKTIRLILVCIIIFSFCIFNANSEKSLREIKNLKLDEKIIERIKREVELPNDYDVARAMKGMEYLVIYEGFSVPGAAGLIGNGYAESRLLINPGKGFYKGLFQWDGKTRWPRIKKFLEQNTVDLEDEEELYFWELSAAINSEDGEVYEDVIEYCRNCNNAKDSAERWCRKFEGVTQALSTRKRIALLSVDAFEIYMSINSDRGCINMSEIYFDINKLIEFTKQKHKGQKRIQGTPYYQHPLAVRNILKSKGFDEEYQIAGLFHDLLEDTDTTYYEIIEISNVKIAEAVRLVTKEPNYSKKDYYSRIKQNDMARMVKLADRVHNLRDANFTSRTFKEKYIQETEEYFIDLAKDTVFEEDINDALRELKDSLNEYETV